MKHIKTLLAIATVALLGSSAQADTNITMKVGEVTEPAISFVYKNSRGEIQTRWFQVYDGTSGVTASKDAAASKVASVMFVTPTADEPAMSATACTEALFKFTGVAAGKVTWSVYTFTDASPYKDGEVTLDHPFYGAQAHGASGNWAQKDKYNITVTDTPVPEGTLSIDSELEKGAKLSGVKFGNLEGKMIDTNKKEVEGTYAWKNGDETLKRGTAGYAATFTPTELYYDPVDVTVEVTVLPPEQVTPVFVKATRTTLTGSQKNEVQYEGFLTEKGCKYTWGKNGDTTMDWSESSDGTPMVLAKDPADADQLFVKRPAK